MFAPLLAHKFKTMKIMRKLMIIMFAIFAMAMQANAQKVYVTANKGAIVYHKSDKCGYLKNSANVKAVSMAEAQKMKLQPCKVCYAAAAVKATKQAVETAKVTTAKAVDKTNKTMDKAGAKVATTTAKAQAKVVKAEATAANAKATAAKAAVNTKEKVATTMTKAADKNAKTTTKAIEKTNKTVNQAIEKNK